MDFGRIMENNVAVSAAKLEIATKLRLFSQLQLEKNY
jgi:hypothetical protein